MRILITITMLGGSKIPSHDKLEIYLAAPPGWTFAPGDTIIGNVVRKAHLITPEASITLFLRGIIETKYTAQSINETEHGARWNLLGLGQQRIFQGPLHIPRGKDEYLISPFELKIPMRPWKSPVKYHSQEKSFLSLDDDSVTHHTLAGSFSSHQNCDHARIEYYLEAVLRYSYGGSHATSTATCCIVLRHTSIEPALFYYQVNQCKKRLTVQSQRLMPGMENAHLSFRQKTQKFFGSLKVPQASYRVVFGVPKKVQLNNPDPMPFIVKIIPVFKKTSRIVQNIPQMIEIHSVKLTVEATTEPLPPGNFKLSNGKRDNHTIKHTVLLSMKSPIVFSVGEGGSEVDIGRKFEIRLHTDGLKVQQEGTRRVNHYASVYPDFISYLIRHKHWLLWEISLSVAGERQKVGSSASLEVVAAD